MSKEDDKNLVKNTLQMLVYQEALDILVEQYIRNFIYHEEIPDMHTYFLEQQLKQDVIDEASEKIGKIINQAYKEKYGTKPKQKNDRRR